MPNKNNVDWNDEIYFSDGTAASVVGGYGGMDTRYLTVRLIDDPHDLSLWEDDSNLRMYHGRPRAGSWLEVSRKTGKLYGLGASKKAPKIVNQIVPEPDRFFTGNIQPNGVLVK